VVLEATQVKQVEIHLLPRMPLLLMVVAAVVLTLTPMVLLVVQAVAVVAEMLAHTSVMVHPQRPLVKVTQAAIMR
jgi:hypothetical protein